MSAEVKLLILACVVWFLFAMIGELIWQVRDPQDKRSTLKDEALRRQTCVEMFGKPDPWK